MSLRQLYSWVANVQSTRARLPLGAVSVLSLMACADSVVQPLGPPRAVYDEIPQEVAGSFLVPDGAPPSGPLLFETTIEVPALGFVDDTVETPLWDTGAVDGPAVIEIASTLAPGTASPFPAADLVNYGVLMWYEHAIIVSAPGVSAPPPGTLALGRSVGLRFASHTADSIEVVDTTFVPGTEPTIRLIDADASLHGLTMRWYYFGGIVSYGFNPSDPSCVTVGFRCVPLPDWTGRIGDGPPSGTIRVRVYGASQAETGTVRVESETSRWVVRPSRTGGESTVGLRVGVYDENDVPIPDRTVVLSVDGIERTGGHEHGGEMPSGSLSATVVNTGASGVATVTYSAPVFGGTVAIRGTSGDAAPSDHMIAIQVEGLVQLLQEGNVVLVGQRDEHPDSHWGTPGMVEALVTLGDSVAARYGVAIQVNDMSLPYGGKFDLGASYGPGGAHAEHRVGTSADFRTVIFSTNRLKYVQRVWETLGGSVYDETTGEFPHYHLRY